LLASKEGMELGTLSQLQPTGSNFSSLNVSGEVKEIIDIGVRVCL
jgi:hypothetical protein